MRNTERIELFGKRVVLAERDSGDVLNLIDFAKKNNVTEGQQIDAGLSVYINLTVVVDGLKQNIKKPQWLFWWWNKKFSLEYIEDKLTVGEVMKLAAKVMRLEGFEANLNGKKKSKSKEPILEGNSPEQ